MSLCWQPGSDLLSLCPWPHMGQSQQGHVCCGCTKGASPQFVPSLVTGTVLSTEFGFSPALSCTAGTTAGQSLWMSWRGCARSEPCRLTDSTPRSGESMSSPTQVLGCSGEPGELPRLLCAPAFITSLVRSLCRVTRKLCGVHGPGGAPRQDHGAGPARWWPPHPRLHDRQEEDLCHVCLLRVHALQGRELLQPKPGCNYHRCWCLLKVPASGCQHLLLQDS